MSEPSLSVRNLSKSFPGVKALNDASIDFYPGEVHALLGANGAGKSTLCKILSGAYGVDSGKIIVHGKEYKGFSPARAKQIGIGMIYQEFNLVPGLNVYENIFLGKELRSGLSLKKADMINETRRIFDQLKISLDPKTKVKSLSVAYQELIEIGKAVYENANILIMDEPTAPLTNEEVQVLFSLIKDLKKKGVTIIYITHRIEELFKIAEKVTVMCDGRVVKTLNTKETTRQELVNLMVGRTLGENYPSKVNQCGKTALSVKNLNTSKVKDVSFELYSGEILGLAGLIGSGRTEVARAIFGADPRISGEITVKGRSINIKSPADAIEAGICLIPEDRKRQGIHLKMSVKENISIVKLRSLSRFFTVKKKSEEELINKYINTMKIKTPTPMHLVNNLSGGNQQKVVVSKWLATNCDVIILDEPTRGIDIGAKQEIYTLMDKLRSEGKAIIMISSELPELIGMSNRVLTMYEGKLNGVLTGDEITQSAILELASGGTKTNVAGEATQNGSK